MKLSLLFCKPVFLFILICVIIIPYFSACAAQTSNTSTAPAMVPVPSSTNSTGPKYAGILRVADANDGVSIGYPAKMGPAYGPRQMAPALETLFRYDKDGKIVPWLATGEKSDPSSNTITITLQKGVKFHDGTSFDAAAVKWNLEQQIAAKVAGTLKIKEIEIVDDYTLRIRLSSWDSTVISNFSDRMGIMTSPTAFQKNGAEWVASNCVGTGPFQLVSWQKQTKTIFKKFEDYWQNGKPYLDGIENHVISDINTRRFALEGKEIDLAETMQAKDAVEMQKIGYNLSIVLRGSGAFGLMPDSANPNSPFANIKVRQAVAHAIDTKKIASEILYGLSEPTNQYNYKSHWGYNPAVVGYPYDPDRAIKLLAEAGYSSGFKTKLTYLIILAYTTPFEAAQGYLKKIGIDVEMDPAQAGRVDQIMGQAGFKSTGWDGLFYSTGTVVPDVVSLCNQFFSGNMYKSLDLPPDTIQALQNAVGAHDFASKQKAIQEWQRLMIDKYCLLIPMYALADVAVVQPYVKDHGIYGTANIQQWAPESAWLDKK